MSHVPHKLAHCRTTVELRRQATYYCLRTQDALRRSASDAIELIVFSTAPASPCVILAAHVRFMTVTNRNQGFSVNAG